MRRLLGAVLLCVTLTASLPAAAATAQQDTRQPKALWEEFPLEPAATPAPEATPAAAEPAARPPAPAPRPPDDGIAPATLVALLAAVLGLGALALFTIRRRTAGVQPRAVAAVQPRQAIGRQARARQSAAAALVRPSIPARARPSAPSLRAAQRLAPSRYIAAADAAWEECRIKFHSRTIKSHFYAVPYEGGPLLARSPYFEHRRGDGAHAVGAADALHALVEELTMHGWCQSGTGRSPWDLRFERAPLVQSRRD